MWCGLSFPDLIQANIDITVHNGQLTIRAERGEKTSPRAARSFPTARFVRSVTLPAGASDDDITATYDKGILSVSVAVAETTPAEKHIAVQSAS